MLHAALVLKCISRARPSYIYIYIYIPYTVTMEWIECTACLHSDCRHCLLMYGVERRDRGNLLVETDAGFTSSCQTKRFDVFMYTDMCVCVCVCN